jgi:hypothetical protein
MNVEPNDLMLENPNQDFIHVTSKHLTYNFQVGNLVALVSRDTDPFWLAYVRKVLEDSLTVTYFHHSPFKSGQKLVWKPHNSNGTCRKYAVYVRFKGKEQLFTKGKTI